MRRELHFFSDFDIGIEAKAPSIIKLEELKEMIDKISGLYSVDLVFLNDVEQDFADIVKKQELWFMKDDIFHALQKVKKAVEKLKVTVTIS